MRRFRCLGYLAWRIFFWPYVFQQRWSSSGVDGMNICGSLMLSAKHSFFEPSTANERTFSSRTVQSNRQRPPAEHRNLDQPARLLWHSRRWCFWWSILRSLPPISDCSRMVFSCEANSRPRISALTPVSCPWLCSVESKSSVVVLSYGLWGESTCSSFVIGSGNWKFIARVGDGNKFVTRVT